MTWETQASGDGPGAARMATLVGRFRSVVCGVDQPQEPGQPADPQMSERSGTLGVRR